MIDSVGAERLFKTLGDRIQVNLKGVMQIMCLLRASRDESRGWV